MREQASAVSGSGGQSIVSSRPRPALARTTTTETVAALERSRAEEPRAQSLARLADLLATYAPHDGSFQLRVPGVHAIRRSTVSRDMVRATVSPALCIVAQGAKVVVLGRETYSYDTSRMIASASASSKDVDAPVVLILAVSVRSCF